MRLARRTEQHDRAAPFVEQPPAVFDEQGNARLAVVVERGQRGADHPRGPVTVHPRHIEETKKKRFAGRSASRRIKYGYHWEPNGTAMRMGTPRSIIDA